MTEKLYYKDAYQTEAECTVREVIEKDGKVEVVLDQTIFYPEGGGQPSDKGSIDGIAVYHVREQDDIIYHRMKEAPKGRTVQCRIDWERRFRHMQQHSGEHILSGALLKLYGGMNKGFHMGEDYMTLDIDIKDISEEMLERTEREVNEHIYRNSEVTDVITNREGLKLHKPRKQIDAEDNIRIVTMGEIDCCACCGTHVKQLGEIGLVKILKAEAYKGMTRIYALCGQMAFDDYVKKNKIIKTVKKQLSAEEEGIVGRIDKMQEEMNRLRQELHAQKAKTAKELAKGVHGSSEMICLMLEDQDFEIISHLEEILKDEHETLILASIPDRKLSVLTKKKDHHVGNFFKSNLKEYGGKGGGRNDRAQASFDDIEGMKNFIKITMEDFGYEKV